MCHPVKTIIRSRIFVLPSDAEIVALADVNAAAAEKAAARHGISRHFGDVGEMLRAIVPEAHITAVEYEASYIKRFNLDVIYDDVRHMSATDLISTAAEETREPQRNLPRGILGGLAICTAIYVVVGAVMVGMVPYRELAVADPLARALELAGFTSAGWVVTVGAVVSMAAVLLVFQYGQPRIFFAMARDGADARNLGPDEFPAFFKKEVEKYAKLVKLAGAKPE